MSREEMLGVLVTWSAIGLAGVSVLWAIRRGLDRLSSWYRRR